MSTFSVPLQAYRRGLGGFDGATVLGVKVVDAAAGSAIQAAGSRFYFAIYAYFPDETTGTGTHCIRDGTSAGASSDGWSVWYNNNAGSGKLYVAMSADGTNGAFGVDWTADGGWYFIEIEYYYNGTAATYDIFIDEVRQATYNTSGTLASYTETTQDVALFQARNTHNGATPLAAVKGDTNPAAGDGGASLNTNLVPSGFIVCYVREEGAVAGVAEYEYWFDSTTDAGDDEEGTYTPSFYGAGATAPTNVAAELSVKEGADTLSDGVEHDTGSELSTVEVENTGDTPAWIHHGGFSGNDITITSEPEYPVLILPGETAEVVMVGAGSGTYTFEAFVGDFLNEAGADGIFEAVIDMGTGLVSSGGSEAATTPFANRGKVRRNRRRRQRIVDNIPPGMELP